MRDRNVIVQEISKAFNSNVPNEFKSSILKYLYMNSVGDISLIESFEYDELPTIEYGGQFISFKVPTLSNEEVQQYFEFSVKNNCDNRIQVYLKLYFYNICEGQWPVKEFKVEVHCSERVEMKQSFNSLKDLEFALKNGFNLA